MPAYREAAAGYCYDPHTQSDVQFSSPTKDIKEKTSFQLYLLL